MTHVPPDPDVDVPAGEEPAARCPYCDRPFTDDTAATLHVGEAHGDRCTDAERDAYEDAHDEEVDSLFFYHAKVVVSLAVLYSVTVLLYMVAIGSGIL